MARFALALSILGIFTSTVFLGMVLAAAWRFAQQQRQEREQDRALGFSQLPRITVLKPLHGTEPRLKENLESFFQQDYPDYEIVFGARDPENEGLRVAEEIRRRYPNVRSRVVLSGDPLWPNAKVYSLDKMIVAASDRDYLVISDSDVHVEANFLREVVQPLLRPEIGLVTCLYRGVPGKDLWSRLEALGMSVEMSSGVMVADMIEGTRFALGAVMAVRRDALEKSGGIAATRDYYSDDFVLGQRVWAAGYKVLVSHHIVDHVLVSRSFKGTFLHQLRWMKSTRFSRPAGHVGSGFTFAVPYGLAGLLSAAALDHLGLGVALFAASLVNRIVQSLVVGWKLLGDRRSLRYCWLYPLRDLLGFLIWVGSFVGGRFEWRGETYRFSTGGKIIPQQRDVVAGEVDSVEVA